MAIAAFAHRSAASKVVFCDGAVLQLAAELELLGVRRPMLLCGSRMRRSAIFRQVVSQLESVSPCFGEDVPAHSSVELVERLVEQAREFRVDGLVALGGGSASDTAKAVALLLAEGASLADHAVRFTPPSTLVAPVLRRPKLPIVAIPCTASGAEANAGLGVRDAQGRKLLFTDLQLVSRVILIDPAANVEMPATLMMSTGMNGIAHCFEGLYSLERSPIAETLALDALARFAPALRAVHREPDAPAHRGELLYAAHLSGLVMLNARTCLHHAICHAIGSVTGVGHGDANSVLLPRVLEFNAEAAGPALRRAAEALGVGSGSDPLAAVDALRDLRAAIGAPTRLRDIGVSREALPRIADKAMGERGLYYNPRRVENSSQVLELLEAAC